MIGSESRNETRRGRRALEPEGRAAVIVTPERETPGWSASACATPSHHPFDDRDVLEIAVAARAPVDDVQHHAEDREHHGDQPWLPQ